MSDGKEKPIHLVDFGCKFKSELINYVNGIAERESAAENARYRCLDMLKELIKQVQQRLPESGQTVSSIRNLSPAVILNHTKRVPISDLPFQHLITETVETQYRRIICHDWAAEDIF